MSESLEAGIQILKTEFQDHIKEVLKCPRCTKLPVGSIAVCMTGHHSCRACKVKYTKCGICDCAWNVIGRNYLAESLRGKLKEIKEAQFPDNTLSTKKCGMGGCGTVTTAARMLYHIVQKHVHQLIQWEYRKDTGTYYVVLDVPYQQGMQYHFAGVVGDLGVVFVNFWMSNEGPVNLILKAVQALPENQTDYSIQLEQRNSLTLESSGKIGTCSADNLFWFDGALQMKRDWFMNMPPFGVTLFIPMPIQK